MNPSQGRVAWPHPPLLDNLLPVPRALLASAESPFAYRRQPTHPATLEDSPAPAMLVQFCKPSKSSSPSTASIASASRGDGGSADGLRLLATRKTDVRRSAIVSTKSPPTRPETFWPARPGSTPTYTFVCSLRPVPTPFHPSVRRNMSHASSPAPIPLHCRPCRVSPVGSVRMRLPERSTRRRRRSRQCRVPIAPRILRSSGRCRWSRYTDLPRYIPNATASSFPPALRTPTRPRLVAGTDALSSHSTIAHMPGHRSNSHHTTGWVSSCGNPGDHHSMPSNNSRVVSPFVSTE